MFTGINKQDFEEKSYDRELLTAVVTLLKRHTRSENYLLAEFITLCDQMADISIYRPWQQSTKFCSADSQFLVSRLPTPNQHQLPSWILQFVAV